MSWNLICSVCGKTVSERFPYCPYCGTRQVASEPLASEPCPYFHVEYGRECCWGTKEIDSCSCGGNRNNCDFTPRYAMYQERNSE